VFTSSAVASFDADAAARSAEPRRLACNN